MRHCAGVSYVSVMGAADQQLRGLASSPGVRPRLQSASSEATRSCCASRARPALLPQPPTPPVLPQPRGASLQPGSVSCHSAFKAWPPFTLPTQTFLTAL